MRKVVIMGEVLRSSFPDARKKMAFKVQRRQNDMWKKVAEELFQRECTQSVSPMFDKIEHS